MDIWYGKVLPHLQQIDETGESMFRFVERFNDDIFFIETSNSDETKVVVWKIDIVTGEQWAFDFKLNKWMYSGGGF